MRLDGIDCVIVGAFKVMNDVEKEKNDGNTQRESEKESNEMQVTKKKFRCREIETEKLEERECVREKESKK